MNKNERDSINEAALEWFDKLDDRALHDLAVSAAIQRRTHQHLNGDPRITLEQLKLVIRQGEPPVPSEAPPHEALRMHAALIAGLAMRMLEDIWRMRGAEPKCDCPACQLRELIEGAAAADGVNIKVAVVDGDMHQALHDWLTAPADPKKH